MVLLTVLAAVVAGCRAPGGADSPAPAAAPRQDDAAETASVADAGIQPVYPRDPGPPDPTAERLCEALHGLPQARKAACCGTPTSSSLAGECVRILTATLRDRAVALRAHAVEACVAEAARALDGCDWVTPWMPPVPAACRGMIVGLLETGAPCRSSLECGAGLFCRGASPTTKGVCAAPGGEGATCGGPADTLATYLRQIDYDTRHPECEGFCRGGRCAAHIAAGGACSSTRQCAPGTHCAAGRCVAGALPALGQACGGGTCAGDAVCAGGRCVALKEAGEPCTSPFECRAACVMTPGATAGTCGPQCASWPPAGYPSGVDRADRKRRSSGP